MIDRMGGYYVADFKNRIIRTDTMLDENLVNDLYYSMKFTKAILAKNMIIADDDGEEHITTKFVSAYYSDESDIIILTTNLYVIDINITSLKCTVTPLVTGGGGGSAELEVIDFNYASFTGGSSTDLTYQFDKITSLVQENKLFIVKNLWLSDNVVNTYKKTNLSIPTVLNVDESIILLEVSGIIIQLKKRSFGVTGSIIYNHDTPQKYVVKTYTINIDEIKIGEVITCTFDGEKLSSGIIVEPAHIMIKVKSKYIESIQFTYDKLLGPRNHQYIGYFYNNGALYKYTLNNSYTNLLIEQI